MDLPQLSSKVKAFGLGKGMGLRRRSRPMVYRSETKQNGSMTLQSNLKQPNSLPLPLLNRRELL